MAFFIVIPVKASNHTSLLFADEIKREREFYRMRGLPCPKDIPPNAGEIEEEKAAPDQHAESDYHRQDEQVSREMF
jgi:polycomb group RING finger protein 3